MTTPPEKEIEEALRCFDSEYCCRDIGEAEVFDSGILLAATYRRLKAENEQLKDRIKDIEKNDDIDRSARFGLGDDLNSSRNCSKACSSNPSAPY